MKYAEPEILIAQGRCPYCGLRTVVVGQGQVCGPCVRKGTEQRITDLEERIADLELVIARQLTPLDVAATHIDILRRKSEEYGPQERDNVALVVEQHVNEARDALFGCLS